MKNRAKQDGSGSEPEQSILHTLIDNLPDGVFLKDRDCRFTFVNQTIADLMRTPDPSALIGKTDRDFYPKEIADQLMADERLVMKTGRPIVNQEETKQSLNGERWILTSKWPVLGAQGTVSGLIGVTRDVTERHDAEERLQVSERRYRELLEYAAEGVFLLDGDGRFLLANAEMCNMLGYTPEELQNVTILDTYPDTQRDAGKQRFEAIKAGQKMTFERTVRRKDGSVFPAEFSARRLHDGALHAIARDITERKRTESELAFERSLLTALLNTTPDHVYFKDLNSRFLRTSRSHARAFGEDDPMAVVGKTDMDFYSVEHARQAYEEEQNIIRSGQPLLNVEECETWPDRPDTWASTTKMPLRDSDGNIIGTYGISRDITERKYAAEKIESLARFPDESPYPVMRITPEGKVTYANKASEAMIASWGDAEERQLPEEFAHAVALAWRAGTRGEIEIRESSRVFIVTIVPFAAAGYINLYGRDVTEEKVLAERLNQSQKMEAIGQLTGGVAHDFNNVLQAVMGYCEVLEHRVTEENRKFTSEIMKAARRAASLTSQLLAFSRRQVLRPRIVDTKELVRSLEKMLRRLIGEDVIFHTIIGPDTGNFIGDPGQLEQVVLNLAINARDAMPTGGNLTVETSNRVFDEEYSAVHPGARIGQFVRIAVSDTGVGMDDETIRHIYEPFFTTKEKGKGTGLGLSTVYGIVKQSGGYINCYSEIGKGTTFTVYLPLTSENAGPPRAEKPTEGDQRGMETVLLVDDDAASRDVARIALEEAGYSVVEASGGEEALSRVSDGKTHIELLITDVVMSQMSGKALAERLRTTYPDLRVVYLSGYTANVISHHGILEEGIDFLEKPFGSRELLRLVREVLDRQ